MNHAVKNKVVKAYPLGASHPMEVALIEEGAIKLREDGQYELFSQEAVNGVGQIAQAGDFFKVDTVDGKHYPYPNARKWFEENHTHIEGDEYLQKGKPLLFWQKSDGPSEEMEWLVKNGKVTLKPEDKEHYFNAFLWGADLSAADDAVVVFYSVTRWDGVITHVDFNFVARPEFEANYTVCSK